MCPLQSPAKNTAICKEETQEDGNVGQDAVPDGGGASTEDDAEDGGGFRAVAGDKAGDAVAVHSTDEMPAIEQVAVAGGGGALAVGCSQPGAVREAVN
ncbi:hypothetical protein AK812_SmicGene43853 [Symbiodinium microadriaticum]|uniref:Uncharacterized protein n=1 Tax=Symbiodinium microadriaticum TaxID=2951 RepID=A0A1Q9C050_SYMMI|nr:hypothetical protein AK812_SmicGene43853 [Symbiodinium microadriaticum]